MYLRPVRGKAINEKNKIYFNYYELQINKQYCHSNIFKRAFCFEEK